MSRCSRALETIIQAHWVDCFEARVKNIGVEKPFMSSTETKMSALRDDLVPSKEIIKDACKAANKSRKRMLVSEEVSS